MSELLGFNNLTKALSFNLYDFAVALNDEERASYIKYIDERYSAKQIEALFVRIAEIIDANVLNISSKDFDPYGASVVLLMSDLKASDHADLMQQTVVNVQLDKSHICAHTYPDSLDPEGICSFRVDIDIATCGAISPLHALNFMLNSFESDVVVCDYVVRGFTRNSNGKKIYTDHKIDSIQEFIAPNLLSNYEAFDDNVPETMTYQTRLLQNSYDESCYFRNPMSVPEKIKKSKLELIRKEMHQIYRGISEES